MKAITSFFPPKTEETCFFAFKEGQTEKLISFKSQVFIREICHQLLRKDRKRARKAGQEQLHVHLQFLVLPV